MTIARRVIPFRAGKDCASSKVPAAKGLVILLAQSFRVSGSRAAGIATTHVRPLPQPTPLRLQGESISFGGEPTNGLAIRGAWQIHETQTSRGSTDAHSIEATVSERADRASMYRGR